MRRHHKADGGIILPDAYESPIVPKNTGVVLLEQQCSLGGVPFNQGSAGITPGNYMEWLGIESAGKVTDGFWPSWTINKFVVNAFDKFNTIETDEIAWFDRNVTFHTGLNGNGWVDAHLGTADLTTFKFFDRVDAPGTNDFLHNYGGYFPWGDVTHRSLFFPTTVQDGVLDGNVGFRVFDISPGQVQPYFDTVDQAYRSTFNILNWQGKSPDWTAMKNVTGGTADYGSHKTGVWKVPETNVILQLIGQLPRHNEINGTGNRWDDVLDFFLINREADPIKRIPAPIGDNWYHKNISGLGFLPNGKFQSRFEGQTVVNPDHFGVAACITTFKSTGNHANGHTMIAMGTSRNTTDIQGNPVAPVTWTGMSVSSIWTIPGHGGGLRYCRIKTVEERGYKLVVDTGSDRVLVTPPDDPRTDIPIGLERGVALRYMNREKKRVVQKWSTIQAEATALAGTVTIEA